MEIGLTLAVDYTGSNGNPALATSLHYQGGLKPNSYHTAIDAIGTVLQEYDSDKKVPAFGYGGLYQGTTNHCFPLNFNPANPELPGIPAVLAAYKNTFTYVGLSGPTLFSPVLRQTLNEVKAANVSQANQKYFLLLIITDGAINDMGETIDTLVEMSHYAVSVVIVGVGNADFTASKFGFTFVVVFF